MTDDDKANDMKLVGNKYGPYDLSELTEWEADFWHVVGTRGELPPLPKSGEFVEITAQLDNCDTDSPGKMTLTVVITANGMIRNKERFDATKHVV